MTKLFALLFSALAGPALAGSGDRFCPDTDDLKRGVVLERDDTYYGDTYVQLRDDGALWVGMQRLLGPDAGLSHFADEHVLDHGFLMTKATSMGAPSWQTTWLDYDQSLAGYAELGERDYLVISGIVTSEYADGPHPASLRLFYHGDGMTELGGCAYRYFNFGAQITYRFADGTEKKTGGHFLFAPDLALPFHGIWHGRIHGITGFRKVTETHLLGD